MKFRISNLFAIACLMGVLSSNAQISSTSKAINYFNRDSLQKYRYLSPEAIDILARPMHTLPEGYTSADTLIFSHLFLPVIFDSDKIFSRERYEADFHQKLSTETLSRTYFSPKSYLQKTDTPHALPTFNNTLLASIRNSSMQLKNIYINHPELVELTVSMLPEKITYTEVRTPQYDGALAMDLKKENPIDKDELSKVKLDPIYWIPTYESTIQFSQNHISENWHKGGNNSLNIFMRNYLNMTYRRDRVIWVNELESKFGITNANKDSVNRYKLTDDLLRLHSNFGLKATKHWYYTVDGELRTQLFENRKQNSTDLLTAILSPVAIDAGIGMKYELKKDFASDKFKKLHFTANIAPIGISYLYTMRDDIDKSRIGFDPDQRFRISYGASLKALLDFDISQTINWQSRFFYNTSFDRIESEWENTLSVALNRYFSTRLNVHLRYDDAVRGTTGTFKDLLQYTELFSFGFNYKFTK